MKRLFYEVIIGSFINGYVPKPVILMFIVFLVFVTFLLLK